MKVREWWRESVCVLGSGQILQMPKLKGHVKRVFGHHSKSLHHMDHKIKTQAPATTWTTRWFHEEHPQSDKQTHNRKSHDEKLTEGTEAALTTRSTWERASEWAREEQVYIPPEGKTTAKIMGTKTNKRGRKGNKINLNKKSYSPHTVTADYVRINTHCR